MSGIRRWELRARIVGRISGEVIFTVLAVLISCGMNKLDRTGETDGVWVLVSVPRWHFMDCERALQVL